MFLLSIENLGCQVVMDILGKQLKVLNANYTEKECWSIMSHDKKSSIKFVA
jgi:hypothetical protein